MILLQFSAGRGPLECSRAVYEVSKRFIKEAYRQGLTISIIEEEPDVKSNCYKSQVLSVSGKDATKFVTPWIGSIQWIERSPFRTEHKRKNWFISVASLPAIEESSIDMSQIKIETMRSSGAGGQHVNKTESAVRITHTPSGISVAVSAERSQMQNKRLALSLLAKKIEEIQIREKGKQTRENWQNHNELVRGNPVKVFRK